MYLNTPPLATTIRHSIVRSCASSTPFIFPPLSSFSFPTVHSFIFFIFFIFLHFSFIFFHVLSFLHFFLFFHFLSFSFIFFHFLSFSFIFCHFLHFLSFSVIFFLFFFCFCFFLFVFLFLFLFFFLYSCFFSLSGAQNLFFFGPQFRFDFSSIFRPVSEGYPFGASFPFFPSFFLLFFSFSFSWILFFFSFFFFCFFFFLFKKKFFFICFSFVAFVSGFNKRCFLRSRSSMEMWCLDDIGRDSWDWVGPPAWGRACFNSPEWGWKAPRLL